MAQEGGPQKDSGGAPIRHRSKKLTELRAFFAGQKDVRLAYLFGSQVNGTAGPSSDYDIGVLPSENVASRFRLELMWELSQLLGVENVDVVLMDRARVELVYCIIAQGQLLYEEDTCVRVDFEARLLSKSFDFLPVLKQRRRTIIEEAIS